MTGTVGAAARSDIVRKGARLGYVVSGVLHLLLGLLAVRLATVDPGAQVDQSGAFSAVAGGPFGSVLLVVMAVGLGLLGLWCVGVAFAPGETKDRLKSAGKGVGYLALAAGAAGVVFGLRSLPEDQTKDLTARLLALPAGMVVVVLLALVVAGIGVYHVVKGWRRSFREDLTAAPPHGIEVLGMVGYIAKGLALVGVGVLFLQAALAGDPSRAGGLDGALGALLAAPLGALLVVLIGLGFAAMGVYLFARARWART